MNPATRRDSVAERILAAGEIDFATLAAEMRVSEMTIRRDIEALERRGIARRVLGGAIAVAGKATEPSFEARAATAAEEKAHLAARVVADFRPHQTVILDSGSTVLAVAKELRGKGLGLTIVTPSLLVALELANEPDTTVLLTGGQVRPGELSLVGPEATETLAGYNGDVFVMGVAGIDAKQGASDYHREESSVKRQAVESADKVIAVVDGSKLGRTHLVTVAPLNAIDQIVTDAPPGHPVLARARTLGVEVSCVVAPVRHASRAEGA